MAAKPFPFAPFLNVAGRRFLNPEEVALHLARKSSPDSLPRLQGTTAFHLSGVAPVKMLPREWDSILTAFQALIRKLKRTQPTHEEGSAAWDDANIQLLPANVYVWRDEFEQNFEEDFSENVSTAPRRDGDNKPNFSPFLTEQQRAMILESTPSVDEMHVQERKRTGRYTLEEAAMTIAREAGVAGDAVESLAALFDRVPVAALEKMFPASGKWKTWAERAASNKLKEARESRGMFNPYRAALWFLGKGVTDWDLARCNRVLANNLPARSLDRKHLLTGELP